MKTTMDLSSGLPKMPVCKISLSYDDHYYIDFMVRTDPRITEGQKDRHTDTQTHPQTTGRISVETYSPRVENVGNKNSDFRFCRKRRIPDISR